MGVETKGQLVGGYEYNILVFLLVKFHLFVHFLAHVGSDLYIYTAVGWSF